MSVNSRPSNLPTIIVAIVALGLGYGFGNFQGNLKSSAVAEQAETAQQQAKRSSEAVTNVETRADRLDAYRLTALALVDMDAGEEDSAADRLSQVSSLLKKQKEPDVQEMGAKAAALSKSPSTLKARRAETLALLKSFEALTPRMAGTQSN